MITKYKIWENNSLDLIDTVKNNNIQLVKKLINTSADLNIQDNGGATALINTVRNNGSN